MTNTSSIKSTSRGATDPDQHRLAFGTPAAADPNAYAGGVRIASPTAYAVPVSDGWLVYTRFHSCRAYLRTASGWTQEQVDILTRILDGEVVL
jgi:hypothetical protein